MSTAISIENLVYRYPNGHEALRNVSLHVETGCAVALIGKNGAGKTTLAKHFNSLLKPSSGKVVVAGVDTSKISTSQMARMAGYVFQNPEDQLFGSSVLEEVTFGPKNLGMNQEEIKRHTENALEMVGLLPYVSEHPYNMTYGQRKMLCLASVLAMDPAIVVMDEPNAGQDYYGLHLLESILGELKRLRKTIVVISHDVEFIAKQCEEVALMSDGKVIAFEPTRQILSDPTRLALSGVRPPQVTRLAISLSIHGIRRDVITVEEMAQLIVEHKTKAAWAPRKYYYSL